MAKRALLGAAALAAAAAVGLAAWAQLSAGRAAGPARVEVVAAFPHDPGAFTQGLAIADGALYEGTGQYGRSTIRRVDVETGRVEQSRSLAARYFGEGVTILNGRLYQLTWRAGLGLVYALDSFELLETFRYDGEGWGLATDGERLVMSDGTATLRFLDPDDFRELGRVTVRENGTPLARLNELEHVDGEIWANIWYEDRIVRIDPESGDVLGSIDASRLYPRAQRASEAVLNGIAYDAAADRLLVTGKNWPHLFEIRVVGR